MKKILTRLAVLLYTATACMLLFGNTLMAYIDPSVVTILIQASAGVVIALGAAIGIYWRKAKKKINNTLGIDENKNKEVEDDEIVDDTETAEVKEEAKEETEAK